MKATVVVGLSQKALMQATMLVDLLGCCFQHILSCIEVTVPRDGARERDVEWPFRLPAEPSDGLAAIDLEPQGFGNTRCGPRLPAGASTPMSYKRVGDVGYARGGLLNRSEIPGTGKSLRIAARGLGQHKQS